MGMLSSLALLACGGACCDCSRTTYAFLGTEISFRRWKLFPKWQGRQNLEVRNVLGLLMKGILLSVPPRWSALSAALRAHLCQSSAKGTKHDWEIHAVQCFSELTFRLEIMLVLIFLDSCFQRHTEWTLLFYLSVQPCLQNEGNI